MRVLLTMLLVLALAAPAHASPLLTKRRAQHETVYFANITAGLDPAPGVTVHVVAPSKCHRRDHATVLCWFSVHLVSEPRSVNGFMRIHRQRDGLIGYKLPWDPLAVGVYSS